MDASMNLFMGVVFLLIGLAFVLGAWRSFKAYKKHGELLSRKNEMTGTTNAVISELVQVRRRNRSFKWINEYPVFSYQVNGETFTISMSYAEERGGKYKMGGNYTVHYVPSEPACAIVEEFEKKLVRSRRNYMIATVILAIFAINVLCSAITTFVL